MNNHKISARICLVPHLKGLGGMVSFQSRLAAGLTRRGIQVSYDLHDPDCSAVLVVGGTRRLLDLWRARRRGVRIVQRLDGMNWLHHKQPTPWRRYLRAEVNNLVLAFIRRFVATDIVYQSGFSKEWWEREHGNLQTPSGVIYNGVELDLYSPQGPQQLPDDHFRILLIEGHMGKENAQGLESALKMVNILRNDYHLSVELVVAGQVSQDLQASVGRQAKFLGVLPKEQIPQADRSAHLLFSADLNAACPNAVIEAMACGLPVLAYDTGALNELVTDGAGLVIPYGSNHWNLEPPQVEPLARAAAGILKDNLRFRPAARARAETAFGIDCMLDGYIQALLP